MNFLFPFSPSIQEASDDVMPTPRSCVETKKHTIRQAELQRELGEINRILSTKQALAEKIQAAEDQVRKTFDSYDKRKKKNSAHITLFPKFDNCCLILFFFILLILKEQEHFKCF